MISRRLVSFISEQPVLLVVEIIALSTVCQGWLHQNCQCLKNYVDIIITMVRLAPVQCVALLAANNLQSGLSSASSVTSSMLRLWSFFIVAIQEMWGHPASLSQSLWKTVVRILLASVDSSILAKWANSIRCLFWIIETRGGWFAALHDWTHADTNIY